MKICVSCEADVEGKRAVPIREDRIIKGIRAIKKLLNVAQMNELFVCEGCMARHMERRRSFEKSMLFASVLAGILLVLVIVVPIISGRFEAWIVLSGAVLSVFLLAFPMMKYAPAVQAAAPLPGAPKPMPPPSPPLPDYQEEETARKPEKAPKAKIARAKKKKKK